MNNSQLENFVLKALGHHYPEAKDLNELFEQYGVHTTREQFAQVFGQLLSKDFINLTDSLQEFSLTEKGFEASQKVKLDLAELEQISKSLLLPSFKPSNWKDKDLCIHQPLLKGFDSIPEFAGTDMPLISYGLDLPDHFRSLQHGQTKASIDEIHEEAVENLKTIQPKVFEQDLGKFRMLIVAASFYAGEKVLDHEFMETLHKKLDTDFLMVTLPRKAFMLVAPAVMPLNSIEGFLRIVAHEYENPETPSLTKTVFTMQDGYISGIMQASYGKPKDKQAEEPKKGPDDFTDGFFMNMFGKL